MRKANIFFILFNVFLLTFLFVLPAFSQQRWERTYGGAGTEIGYSVQQTSDGGYVVVGYRGGPSPNEDVVYLIKTNAVGDTLWTRTYEGRRRDGAWGWSVRQTTDGGYIIAGYSGPHLVGLGHVYLIKINATGDTLWTRTYGGAWEEGHAVQQTLDGGYIIAGWTNTWGSGVGDDVYLIRTNGAGDTLWTRTYGGANNDEGWSVQQTSDTGYIISGVTKSFSDTMGDVYLIKTNVRGDTLWTRTYGGARYDCGLSVGQTSDGGYIIAGYTNSFGVGGYDFYLIKTNGTGDTLWTRTFGGTRDDCGWSAQQTSDGGYVIAGWTNSFTDTVGDVYLIKTDASGDTLWTRTYGGTSNDWSYSVQQTSDGGYIVAGGTGSFGAGGADVYLIKTDGNGNVGVEEKPEGSGQKAVSRIKITPNPFNSFAMVPGQEKQTFELYDIAGRKVGAYRGDRIGANLPAGVYFLITSGKNPTPVRIVKVR